MSTGRSGRAGQQVLAGGIGQEVLPGKVPVHAGNLLAELVGAAAVPGGHRIIQQHGIEAGRLARALARGVRADPEHHKEPHHHGGHRPNESAVDGVHLENW